MDLSLLIIITMPTVVGPNTATELGTEAVFNVHTSTQWTIEAIIRIDYEFQRYWLNKSPLTPVTLNL